MSVYIDSRARVTGESLQINHKPVPNFYRASAADFKKIPGSPIAYWASERVRYIFSSFTPLSKVVSPMQGMTTTDNKKFIREWFEIKISTIGFNLSKDEAIVSTFKWFPINKGGGYRKWYGNDTNVVNFLKNGIELKHVVKEKYRNASYAKEFTDEKWDKLIEVWVLKNQHSYFKKGITWSKVSSADFSVRCTEEGYIFTDAGSKIFCSDEMFHLLAAVLNSKLINPLLNIISPTLNFEQGNIKKLPIIAKAFFLKNVQVRVYEIVSSLISIAKSDWDSYETSWDFTTLPLLQPEYHHPSLADTYTELRAHWQEMTLEMKRLEEENNRIFIEAYGLQDELTPEVPLYEITLTCNPHYRYKGNKSEKELEALLLTDTIKEFISYAIGCMFGRYSLDKPGLILANQGETIDDYLQQVPKPSFMPDDDNIIPILDDEYFTDDIVGRFKEFLKATFGEESLAENLEFIAEVLSKSKKGSASPEKVIRDYFLKSFFKDHVKTHKKRPIYWLFTSGKGRGFNALVYMHRYNRETLAKMRTDYLLELEAKLDARIGMPGDKSATEKGRLGKQIEELAAYDEVLHNKSLEYIDIDLDDGVKVNYAKFEGLVGKI